MNRDVLYSISRRVTVRVKEKKCSRKHISFYNSNRYLNKGHLMSLQFEYGMGLRIGLRLWTAAKAIERDCTGDRIDL